MVPLILLVLPILEIAGFIIVGGWIGVLATIGLVVLASVTGAILLRVQGLGALRRLQRVSSHGGDPGPELAHGAMILLAGLLLLIPGFITDIFGLLLFLPPVRDLVWRSLRGRISVVSNFSFRGPSGGETRGPRGRTIDLDEDDYARDTRSGSAKPSNQNTPWRIDNQP